MIRRVVSFAALLMAIFLLPSCGKKTQTLNLLVWEGYADPSYSSRHSKSRITVKFPRRTWVPATNWSPSFAVAVPEPMT